MTSQSGPKMRKLKIGGEEEIRRSEKEKLL